MLVYGEQRANTFLPTPNLDVVRRPDATSGGSGNSGRLQNIGNLGHTTNDSNFPLELGDLLPNGRLSGPADPFRGRETRTGTNARYRGITGGEAPVFPRMQSCGDVEATKLYHLAEEKCPSFNTADVTYTACAYMPLGWAPANPPPAAGTRTRVSKEATTKTTVAIKNPFTANQGHGMNIARAGKSEILRTVRAARRIP